jgi:phytoene dehydrogenase-like protein
MGDMTSRLHLVIIGGGVAGLSAGIYAARSGYSVTVLEMHELPGGLCTSWRRKGYLFDGSVAGLAGTGPSAPIYRLWQDLGVIDGCALYDPEDFGSVIDPDGRTATVYTDIDRLESHFLEEFPRDAGTVRDFTKALRSCARLDIPFPAGEGHGSARRRVRDTAATLRSLPAVVRSSRVTLREFDRRIKDPFCYQVFNNLVHFGGPDVPLLTVLLPLAYAHRRLSGIPQHGWLDFARAIERRFLDLGGEARYRARVTGLRTSAGAVTGVVLEGGEVVGADRVLSAADGQFTRTVLLGEPDDGRFGLSHLSDQPVQVNLGVDEVWDGPARTYLLPARPRAAGRRQSRITVHHKHHDQQAAPPGKSALTVFLESGYPFWQGLAADRPAYEAEKQRCAEFAINEIERRRPGFASHVEVVDVSTPLTRERYTGNRMGAMQARRPDAGVMRALLRGAPRYDHPGLHGFWMAGQWVESWGGITTAAQSGYKAVRAMCRRDGMRFAV